MENKSLELAIIILLGSFVIIWYVFSIFNTTYMQVIKSQCTGISHPGKGLTMCFGIIEALFILGGIFIAEHYTYLFTILLAWNLVWALVNPCKIGSDKKLYMFYVILSFIINLFITSILSIWLGRILE